MQDVIYLQHHVFIILYDPNRLFYLFFLQKDKNKNKIKDVECING